VAPMPAATTLATAASLHASALTEHNLGHPLAALRILRRALAVLADDPDEAARPQGQALAAAIWITQALDLAEVHGLERGLTALQEAQRRADEVGDPALRVRVHSNHAWMATRAGRFELALTQFAAATALIQHADPPDHFGVLLNSGTLRLYRGELAEATRLLTAAVEVAGQNQMAAGQFMALHNLGYAQFLAGDLPHALQAMEAAAQLEVEVSRGISLLDRARVLTEAGLVREADDVLGQAARIFAQERLSQDLGEAEVARAECALLAGDIAAARRFAARGRDRFRRRGNDQWRRTAELVLLQADLAAGRPGARLAPVAIRLEAELRADGLQTRAISASLVAA
jgi:tetratricopeptide (TPR) repeat protein